MADNFEPNYLVDRERLLVMTYNIRGQIKLLINPGAGSVARTVEDAVRSLGRNPGLDVESIRFTVTEL